MTNATNLPDRPASLRRPPRPAADEKVDPVDYVAPAGNAGAGAQPESLAPIVEEPTPELSRPERTASKPSSRPRSDPKTEQGTPPAKPTFTPPSTIATGRPGRPRNREFTAPFSSQLAQDVHEIIDAAVAKEGLTRRAIVEMAIRQTWGSVVEGEGGN